MNLARSCEQRNYGTPDAPSEDGNENDNDLEIFNDIYQSGTFSIHFSQVIDTSDPLGVNADTLNIFAVNTTIP